MMLYLLAIQMFVTTLAHLSSSRHLAAVFCGLVLLCQALVSHYVIHKDDKTGIIKQVACGLPSGKQALEYFSLTAPTVPLPGSVMPVAVSAVFLAAFTILSILAFCLCRQHQGGKRQKKES